MENNMDIKIALRDNLKLLFKIQVAALLSILLVAIPGVGPFLTAGIVALVSALNLCVAFRMRELHPDYQKVLTISVINLGLVLLGNIGELDKVLDIVGGILSVMQMYFFIRATNHFLREIDAQEACRMGDQLWMWTLICQGVAIAIALLVLVQMAVELLTGLVLIAGLITILATLVLTGYHVGYLKKASDAFAASVDNGM